MFTVEDISDDCICPECFDTIDDGYCAYCDEYIDGDDGSMGFLSDDYEEAYEFCDCGNELDDDGLCDFCDCYCNCDDCPYEDY